MAGVTRFTILLLPFDVAYPEVQEGFEKAREACYQESKPTTDMELTSFVRDFLHDEPERLAYNVGFLLGLYTVAQA